MSAIASSVESRVLLVDDDPDVHALVAAMLKPLGVTVAHAMNGVDAMPMVRSAATDLILLDHDMPGRSGLDVLHELRADGRLSRIPVIMVTGSDSHAVLASCFSAGAYDYIRKPFFAAELRARVGSALERQRLLVELVSAARRDRLTGLPNRAFLHDQLQVSIRVAKRSPERGFSLMFLDFDRFKLINDSLGHDVGDQLLRGIADRLRENLRINDTVVIGDTENTVARLGGDEFVVVLDGVTDLITASGIADRLIRALEPPYQLGPHVVRSSASIGIACNSGQYDSPDDMLRDADIAMYEAKSRGKACWVVFSDAMREAVAHRHTLETALRTAVEQEQFTLVYQPIVSLDDHAVAGVEALVRWTHSELGEVTPTEFIPIAEETRLILPLSDWILRTACADFKSWRDALGADAPRYVSVNLSRVQLTDPGLVDQVLGIVRDAGLNAGDLQLEVTESQIMANRNTAVAQLRALRAAGVRLAMDDFGTGYSSLSCLQEFPLDVLKIDREFIANLSRGRDFAALVHAVITLADNLGLEVVAEGIEELAQLAMLQDLGCRDGQGFFIARPMSADLARAWFVRDPSSDASPSSHTIVAAVHSVPHHAMQERVA
jgi:diguanylate cyclase (GGDEF)-like protein